MTDDIYMTLLLVGLLVMIIVIVYSIIKHRRVPDINSEIAQNQRELVDLQIRLTQASERQAEAMEQIARELAARPKN